MKLSDSSRQHTEPLRTMDLFAGCGGFTAGFGSYGVGPEGDVPGFRPVASVESDPAAAATYAANHHPDVPFCGVIEDFDPYPFADEVDVITGGPPCQGFSGLGAQNPSDPRNTLWEEYLRVVAVVRPKVFVLENVDRFLKSPEYERLQDAVRLDGLLADYELSTAILNAADYGVPQTRRRVIVIGTHRDFGAPLQHPTPTHTKIPVIEDELVLFGGAVPLLEWVPVDSIFRRSARIEITGTELPARRVSGGLAGPYRTDELHFGRTPTPLSVARYAAIPQGGNRDDLRGKMTVIDGAEKALSTLSWDKHHSGSRDVMGRLRSGSPSVTIRTEFFKPEKGRYLHPVENRPITHYEAALIQGFPDDYRWYGTKIQIAKQIGNAVPVGLGRALAGIIHQHLSVLTLQRADLRRTASSS
ncbi:DNA cytosine methyltransferase [Streptomyces sp. NPDC088400]|uniref:DNA cytosine methyltransferase n=1 Tax=Streptomyces sp. NPDC088400 TaxID=3365861 RepID=UPI0038195475